MAMRIYGELIPELTAESLDRQPLMTRRGYTVQLKDCTLVHTTPDHRDDLTGFGAKVGETVIVDVLQDKDEWGPKPVVGVVTRRIKGMDSRHYTDSEKDTWY